MHIADLLASDAELAGQAERLQSEPQGPFPLLTAKIKLTWRCNLRCRMCSLWRRAQHPTGMCELPEPLVLDTLDRLRASGVRKVHFSGGEVMLHPGFPAVLARAGELGFQVNLTTNGTRIDKDAARLLVDRRVHAVTVSIDDASPRRHDALRGVDGAWKAAWKGLARIQEAAERKGHGPVLGVNTLITRKGIDHLAELYAMLKERGVQRWRLLPIDTPDRSLRPTAEQWARLAPKWPEWQPLLIRLPLGWQSDRPGRSAHRARQGQYAVDFYGGRICYAPWFNLFIDANGAVYPCCMGKGTMPTFGSLLEKPLDALLESRSRKDLQAMMAAGRMFPICDACDDFLEENAALGGGAGARD